MKLYLEIDKVEKYTTQSEIRNAKRIIKRMPLEYGTRRKISNKGLQVLKK